MKTKVGSSVKQSLQTVYQTSGSSNDTETFKTDVKKKLVASC
jgi:hypothetical protein